MYIVEIRILKNPAIALIHFILQNGVCFKGGGEMINKTWILTANSAVARFYIAETNDILKADLTLTHPDSRIKEGEIVSDAPGQQSSRIGPSRRAVVEVEAKKHEAQVFAGQLCTVLEKLVSDGKLKNLYVAASPEFLGILIGKMHGTVKDSLKEAVDKDLTHQNPEKIRMHFPEVL